MRRLLKIILLTFLCTAAGLAIVLGGVYLFGGFNEKPVYAESISFSETEVVKSGPFSLTVNTSTENVNKKTLLLETSKSPNGDSIISYPKHITIGEPFHIAPILVDGAAVGGYLELYARYEGEGSNQSALATCKILIDVPVKSAELNLNQTILKPGLSIDICKANETLLTDILTLSPANSLLPYANSSSAASAIASGTLFAGQNVKNKKIFMRIESLNDSTLASFRVGEGATAVNSLTTEVTYKFENGKLVATNSISIVTSGENTGSIRLHVYICPSFDSNAESISDLDNLSTPAIHITHDISVINYTIDQMTMANDSASIFLGENTKIYLNNSSAEAGSINLGLNLISSDEKSITLDTLPKSFLNKNVYLKFADSEIGGILSRSSEAQNEVDTIYGINCSSGSDQMNAWYLNVTVNNYQKYLDYLATGEKIKITVTFFDKDGSLGETQGLIQKDFYLAPKISEVARVETTQYNITAKSGSVLSFDKDKYSIKFSSGEAPVGIAKNFDIVHYVKATAIADGKLVLNGVTIDSEFEEKTLNGENILILSNPHCAVTGSGAFKIYSQACYSDGQNLYFLGESCNTDIEVVEAIEYIDCYSYENDKPTNFTKFQFDENEKEGGKSITRYLYVTTSNEQLPKLTSFVASDKLKVSFKQVSGLADETKYNSSTLGGGLSDQNKNAIMFGNWEEVRTGGNIVGYKISYTVNEVTTVQIDDVNLQNLFEIKVFLDISPIEVTTNYKVSSGNSSSLQFEIKDKILQTTVLSLDSAGTTRDNPISLNATVDEAGQLKWTGANLSNLTYGFALEGNTPASISGYSYKFAFEDASLPNGICSFTAQEGFKGGISFASVPYKAEGYLGKFTFLCQNANSDNSIAHWNESLGRFEKIVNPTLVSKDLYFKLTGLNLVVEANSTKISGVNGKVIHVFKSSADDANYLFTLKKVDGTTQTEIISSDYRQFLTLEAVLASKEDNDKISISLAENLFTVNTDFIASSTVTFSFTCQNSTIEISSEDVQLSSISRQILGAFDVIQKASSDELLLGESKENALLAPMFDKLTSDKYLSITYGGSPISADNNPFTSYSLKFLRKSDQTADWLVLNDDGAISLRAINATGTNQTSFVVRILKNDDESVYHDFEIVIYAQSNIKNNDLTIQKSGIAERNKIVAGKNNAVTFGDGISFAAGSELANLADASKITSVTLQAEYSDDGVKNFIKTTDSTFDLNFAFYAGDLASDQVVTIKFKFALADDAGYVDISKEIYVQKNILLTLISKRKSETNPTGYEGFDYRSGDTIAVFRAETYDYLQNGSVFSTLDLSDYADSDSKTDHPHILDLQNVSVSATSELVLSARFLSPADTKSFVSASFVLKYDYNNDGLNYSQQIKFEFVIELLAL